MFGRYLTWFNFSEVSLTTYFKIKIYIFFDHNSRLKNPYLISLSSPAMVPWLDRHPLMCEITTYTLSFKQEFSQGFKSVSPDMVSHSFSTISHMARLRGVSSLSPFCDRISILSYLGKRSRPELPVGFQKIKEMNEAGRVGVYVW